MIRGFRSEFTLLDDPPELYTTWETLVVSLPVVGRKAHDVRLVAAMMVHGLGKILTLNPRDFQGFSGIQVASPGDVAPI